MDAMPPARISTSEWYAHTRTWAEDAYCNATPKFEFGEGVGHAWAFSEEDWMSPLSQTG